MGRDVNKSGRGSLRFQPRKYKGFYIFLFTIIPVFLFVMAYQMLWAHSNPSNHEERGLPMPIGQSEEIILISKNSPVAKTSNSSCLFHTCFDVYHCGYNDDNRITVYIYPLNHYVDENEVPVMLPVSKEFQEITQTVMDSIYYTPDPEKACLFIPPVDVLNQNKVRLKETSQVLGSLSKWNEGTNHLLFNMMPGSSPDYNSVLDVDRDKAILAGGGFSTWSYRQTFDVSIPVFNPHIASVKLPHKSYLEYRKWLLVSTQIGLHSEYIEELTKLSEMHSDDFLLLEACEGKNITHRCRGDDVYAYPQILQESTFCVVLRGARLGQMALSDAIMAGCIPVIIADSYILPFSEVIDWKRAAVVVGESQLSLLPRVLSRITARQALRMRQQLAFLWENYMGSMRAITLTTLQVINDRVFPYAARKYEDWNDPPGKLGVQSPLFLPLIAPKQDGFTAVILTYDRQEMLFKVIEHVAQLPSLAKVLVVWNNQLKQPPPAAEWPKISKPLKVVQTRYNRLSNRFYPYDEIDTEAILALDDDILMLTADELEFGYEVWREFPDRLVGFPSRLHLWDNATGAWRYESEWTSAISMVLTGAAFHHKYYSYLYTNTLPGDIKSWVDDHMNCEDLAMNFLIANTTGKPPIKVAPRQKFKCPECVNQGMLSADMGHMVERTECINKFTQAYGMMPLHTIEFRADPVLYKDEVPRILQRFADMGHL